MMLELPVMPSWYRRHGQDKTLLLSCRYQWCEQNWREVISKLFCPVSKCGEDYWKPSWLVANSVHTNHRQDKTRLVLSCPCRWCDIGITVYYVVARWQHLPILNCKLPLVQLNVDNAVQCTNRCIWCMLWPALGMFALSLKILRNFIWSIDCRKLEFVTEEIKKGWRL